MRHKKYSFAHAFNHRPLSASNICCMLCVSRKIDILSGAEAGFKLDAHFRIFFLDKFHSSFLVPSCPFLNIPAAAALPPPCLTVSDSACSAGRVATAAIHAAGCICGWSRDSRCRLHRRTCEVSDCPCPLPCAAAPPLLTPPLSCAPSSSPQLPAAAPRRRHHIRSALGLHNSGTIYYLY